MQRVGVDAARDLPLDRTLDSTEPYALAAREVAAAQGVACLDLWHELLATPSWQALLSDGLHFTAAGQKALWDIVRKALDKHFPDMRSVGASMTGHDTVAWTCLAVSRATFGMGSRGTRLYGPT